MKNKKGIKMGACCGQERKILTLEKRLLSEGRPDDSFKFDTTDLDTTPSTKSKKKRGSKVRFAD